MEELMLNRLRLITRQIQDFTSDALRYCNEIKDLTNAEVIHKKLETAVNRLTSELHNYFRLSLESSVDDISSFSEIQLKGEEVLSELSIKIKTAKEGVARPERKNVLTGKLPKLNLPEFGGDILEWHQFWDQFDSNIGSRDLADVDKLLYLKASLKGDAKKTIDGLETTNKNYDIAVFMLKTRYGKDSHIIDAHYAALYRIKASTGRSTTDMRETLNEIERHLQVLNSLGEDINHNYLRFLIMAKMPSDVVYELKRNRNTESIEEIRQYLELIISAREDTDRITTGKHQEECTTVRSLHSNTHDEISKRWNTLQNCKKGGPKEEENNEIYKVQCRKQQKRKPEEQYRRREIRDRKRRKRQCIFCQEAHFNDQCENFKTLQERTDKLKIRCFGCFNIGHSIGACKKDIYCIHCNKRNIHNRALCPKVCTRNIEQTNTLHSYAMKSTVLQTAVVKVRRDDDHSVNTQCRVLLDSGSQRTYVSQAVAKKLNLPVVEENRLSVFTFGSKLPQIVESSLVKLEIETRTKDAKKIFANIVPYITQGIMYPEPEMAGWSHKKGYPLADDGSLSDRVDILIGNDYYHSLMSGTIIKIQDDLYLIDSELGWILSGVVDNKPIDQLSVVTYFQSSCEVKLNQPDPPLDNGSLKFLWDLESIGITDSPKANRDEEAIKHFNENVEIQNNRYQVCWPWNEYPPNLPSNFGLAFGRLINLLKRLDPNTLLNYENTINEQLKKGVIEPVPVQDNFNRPVHYIPHHGVSAPGKALRIVYDASAKTKDNRSLNECLYCGPTILEDLTGLIIKFRCHSIGITADVEKAFLQIGLKENDRDVTRFLWVKDITKPATEENLMHLRFTRVPFGIISSPFLLGATIKHHLLQCEVESVRKLANEIYVDNVVTGAKTIKEAIVLYERSRDAFQQISMNLREWSSNSKELMHHIIDSCQNKEVKVLGLNWQLESDTLQLRVKDTNNEITKRGILKTIASVYDPCGFAVPNLLSAKLFLQKLWIDKYKWDTQLPDELIDEWRNISDQLENIQDIILPRRYFIDNEDADVQLHIFTDASTKAYAAAAYVTNSKEVSFVIGKSRLVPIKDQENLKIPRLELLGVLIGSRLLKYVTEHLLFNVTRSTIWTDSQIVIDWYYGHKLLPPFVSRRIDEIKRNTSVVIRYVPSELNPVDVATRPTSTRDQKESWLSGPKFLLDDYKTWPTNHRSEISLLSGEGLMNEENVVPEYEDVENEFNQVERSDEQETPMKEIPITSDGPLSQIQELIKIQSEFFPEEIKGKETSLKRNLGLFADVDGILRCKGRLKFADWPYDKRYPILIPKDCDFTNKLIRTTHENNYHVGANHTLSLIRQSYWIPQGRRQVQKVLKKCTNCVKHGGGPFKLPPTPALPKERVNFSSPFTYTGIDYMGPLLVSTDKISEKRWICLYTCMAIRAIHLEVVRDLTAEECILALRRFISTRGLPAVIVSDNALQFKLTAEVLSNNYCITNNIQWKFIPQLAPWHGGFYERLVGLVKHCLKRTLTKTLLKENQLVTVIKEIEAVVNTRPLTCVGSDLEDVLRPSDFLTLGKCIMTTSSDNISCQEGTTTKQDLVEGWKRGQNMLNEFKRMFVEQYLPSLRERYQSFPKEPRVTKLTIPKLGDIVQIKGDTKNRENWKVGEIIYLLKGTDGLCRVARVKVGDTEFTRSISHLYPLEIEEGTPERENTANIEYNEQKNVTPMLLDLPLLDKKGNISHSDIQNTPIDCDKPERKPESTSPQEVMENYKDYVTELEGGESKTESMERKTKENNSEVRKCRHASVKARKKIQEWTRDLMDLL